MPVNAISLYTAWGRGMSNGHKRHWGRTSTLRWLLSLNINNITFGETCTPCFLAAKCWTLKKQNQHKNVTIFLNSDRCKNKAVSPVYMLYILFFSQIGKRFRFVIAVIVWCLYLSLCIFCVICLVIFRQSQNKMQALYMADWQTFCDVYSLSTKKKGKKSNFFLSLKVCNYDSPVMKNAVGFYFFVLYLVLFSFCFFNKKKSTTLLWKHLMLTWSLLPSKIFSVFWGQSGETWDHNSRWINISTGTGRVNKPPRPFTQMSNLFTAKIYFWW